MKFVLCLMLASCAAAGPEVEVAEHEEALTIFGGQAAADLAAKQYLAFCANAGPDEMHWFAEGYWQVGGAAFHQEVLARAYWQPSVYGTRVARLDFCHDNVCTYYATYKCTSAGFYSCKFI